MMTREEMDRLMDRHFRADECADPEGAIGDFTAEVDHELAGVHHVRSRQDAKAFYVDLFARLQLRHIGSTRRLYGSDFAVDEAVVDARTASGEPAPFRLLHVFEFRDGQISRECAWRAPLDGE